MSISRGAHRGAWALVVIAGVVAGVLATRPMMRLVLERSSVANGPWKSSPGTGSADAGFYLRSFVAVAGLYALSREETVYYTAFTDSAGAPLDGRCDYRVAGRGLPARWWSLTLYGADHFLVPNAAAIYSRHAGNLSLEPDESYVVPVSAQSRPGNWLPAPAGAFSLTLRLYNPRDEAARDLAAVALPSIARGDCR